MVPVSEDLRGLLLPYVPRLVLEWLQADPAARHRRFDGTLLFADISGFTALTETLARRGKVGAEEMGDILNRVFERLLGPAYEQHGGLLKWGGDAVLLLFDGEQHVERAAVAAHRMQQVMRDVGRLTTSGGRVRLRMSIGMHAGEIDALLVGSVHRELIVTGPAATQVAEAEKTAAAGEIVLSTAAAARLEGTGARLEGVGPAGRLLGSPPEVTAQATPLKPPPPGVDPALAMPPPVLAHVSDADVGPEHRHVAVGFIEFRGADRLAVLDDGGALARAVDDLVTRCQDVAAMNDVTLLSTDVNADGGKLILASGAPRRRGDDEARILTALLDVLADPGILSVRAGASSGRVFAGDFGPPYRRTYSITGDCVNLAARLMGSAEPGELLASEPMAARVESRFATRAIAPLTLKGKAEPVPARLVRRLATTRDRDVGADLPLVGRDAELRQLLDLFEAVRPGSGRSVDLVGAAGIGKSRLLQELARTCSAPVYWVDGDVYGEVTPYHPVRRFIRERLGLPVSSNPSAVASAVADFVSNRCSTVRPWLPLLGRVLDVDYPMTPEVSGLEPAARKERIEWALSELLGAFIAEPSVLIFNDAHLMDEATVDLLRRLTDDTPARSWLLVTSYRPDERARIAGNTVVIPLEALSAEASTELLGLATDARPLPHHVMDRLTERAAGNPLFLKELVAGTTATVLDDQLPSSVEEVIAVRIDRLDAPKRTVLRMAAVLGMEVEPELVAALAAADAPGVRDIGTVLRGLTGFLDRADNGRLAFRHQLVREVAYEGLPYRRRRVLHGRAAELLENATADPTALAALLSLHCFHGQRRAAAWHYSVLAGDGARAKYAMAEAAEFYRRALEVRRGRPTAAVAAVAESLGDVCFELGEFDSAERSYRLAYQRCDEPLDRARLCDRIALIRESTGRYSAALRWMTSGLAHLEGARGRRALELTGQLLVANTRVRYFQGRFREAVQWGERARIHGERIGHDLTLAGAWEYLDVAHAALGTGPEEPLSTGSLRIYEQAGDLAGLGRVHQALGIRAYFRGRWSTAVEHYGSSAEAYERAGRYWAAAVSRANIAEVLSDQGRLDEAEKVFDSAIRTWRAVGAESEVAFGSYMLGRVAARAGRCADAMTLYRSARGYCERTKERGELFTIDSYVAECHLFAGDLTTALSEAERLLAEEHATDVDGPTVPLLHRIRGLSLAPVRPVDALEALRRSVETARRRDSLHDVALGLDSLVAIAPDHPEAPAWRAERADLWSRLEMTAPQGAGSLSGSSAGPPAG